jgi:hypothetical protein
MSSCACTIPVSRSTLAFGTRLHAFVFFGEALEPDEKANARIAAAQKKANQQVFVVPAFTST